MISFCPHLLFLVLLVSSVAASNSVAASPTNDTNALTQQFGSLRFFLSATTNSSVNEVNLAPLTSTLATLDYSSFQCVLPSADIRQRFSAQGALYQTTASNTASITTQDIALISCDPFAYTGYLHVAETVSAVVSLSSGPPAAVVLYSLQSNHCNYTVNDPTVSYTNVFTVVNSTASQLFLSQLSSINTTATADITADMSTSSSASTFGNTTTTGTGGTVSGSTTAVAMIILYTITGIITALFLGIIITGAVRAHRHPERYGPRNVTGRPRQSRARGIARAMLETIPIVKFGDKEDGVDAAKRDLEMASSTHTAETASTETAEDGETAHEEGEITSQTADAVESSNNQTNSNRHSRGLAGYLSDIRRARNAPVEERIEALRRLRQSHQQQQERNGDESATAEESQGRRRHLAMRLRDRFRVRTRQHGSEPSP
ncbi:hypothetical protein ZTR_06008 [Talaromyces verruculosus]|nr:hypothetical protein ZTR_06008 [Talaromyces verruculosus]